MKRLLMILVLVLVLLALAGCGQYDSGIYGTSDARPEQTPGPPSEIPLYFRSWEEFFDAHRAAREGNLRGETARRAERADFASLEKLFLPNLPEAHQLNDIVINESSVQIRYFREFEHLGTQWELSSFTFSFTRWTYEDLESWGAQSPLDGIMRQFGFTEDDLIDGKFFRERTNTLTVFWAYGSNRLSLSVPRNVPNTDIAGFTEVTAVNLLDEDAIAALIGH